MNNVKPFQFLPSPDKPVLTYMGTARAATRPSSWSPRT